MWVISKCQQLWSFAVGSVFKPIEDKQKEAFLRQQVLKIKGKKRQRDIELSSRMATYRDRVWWLIGFYATMGTVSFARMLIIRKFDPLPLRTVPYVLVPFVVAYQADFAYGTKADRINKMATHIRDHENYWFNEPIELPELLKETYYKMMEENNKKLVSMGKQPEK